MSIDLSKHSEGYYGYLDPKIREALAETQRVSHHFDTEFAVGADGGVGVHKLTILSGGLNVLSDLHLVGGGLQLATSVVTFDMSKLPKYEDQAEASGAGLPVGRVYATQDGTLKVVTP